MHSVVNRRKELVPFDQAELEKDVATCAGGLRVSASAVVAKVVTGLVNGMPTEAIGGLVVETAAYMAMVHPDYSVLAGRMAREQQAKGLPSRKFSHMFNLLWSCKHPKLGTLAPLVSDEAARVVATHAAVLDAAVESYVVDLDIFGFKTLQQSYLLKLDGKCSETPEMMYMRVAVGIHGGNIPAVLATYDMFVRQLISHATPTLFNAGTPKPQMSSCFLIQMKDDSIEGIYDTLKTCAMISKYAGGIGLSIHNIRATDSYISGTNGRSNGLVPMLKVFSDTAHYVDQGGGKRKGSFAIYLEPWHRDIFAFLELKKNHGAEEERARDLFYAVWVPDLFMRRVQSGGNWTLLCPNEAPGLDSVCGEEFDALYEAYEAKADPSAVVPAQRVWWAILNSMIETGTPYVMFKDACNRYSNQQHLGVIKSSNLCTEIIQYTSTEEIAVCNLAAVVLDNFVNEADRSFDFVRLQEAVALLTVNLNRVIEGNYYPVPEARLSNLRHRPIGIGVVGLADMFAKMDVVFGSDESMLLNKQIFETMYYAALTASCDLAVEDGPHESFPGSPLSMGKFQFDLMGVPVDDSRHNWSELRERIMRVGVRNSLLTTIMPTASTGSILGREASIDPFFSMAYSRRVLAGDHLLINRYLVAELVALGLWTDDIRERIIQERGSVQNIAAIPERLRLKYRHVFEIPHKTVLRMAADRQPFICQGQSLNAHIAEPTTDKLTSMLFYAWTNKLKNGVYYLRTKPKENPVQLDSLSRAAVASVLVEPVEPTSGGTCDETCTSCSV